MNLKYTPSKYQEQIFDFVTKGTGNAVINAKAGSGKTTTLVEAMKLIPEKEKVLFVAFNKAIEQELSSRLTDYKHVEVKTYHGLGFSLLRNSSNKYKDVRINEYKYNAYINNNITSFAPEHIINNKNDIRIYKSNLKSIIDFVRFNLAQSINEIKQICEKYDITPISNEIDIIPQILEWGKSNTDEIDYTDMIWLCIENDLKNKIFKYDYIFIDEAQDSSIMQQALIKKCYKRGTRFIAIGDDYQCINAFAGADQDAFEKLQKQPNTKILTLPITYRCPKIIVDYVRKNFAIDIKANENAIEGEINYDVNPYIPKDNDMVLCRNTSPLIKLFMKYNRINKKSYLKGRNIGEMFKALLSQINHDYLSIDMMCDGVFPRLYERLFENINKEIEITSMDYEDVVNTQHIMDLIDTIRALEVLSEGLTTKEDLINKIDVIFTDDDREGVCLSTIHKAKGLEADNVFILCPSLMPTKYAKKNWEKIAEDNLIYVAVTRTKKTLNYISEKLFPANVFGENDDIISELEYQRKRMNNALKIDSKPLSITGMTFDEKIKNDVKNILNTHNSKTHVVNEKKRQNVGANKLSKFLK